MLYQSAANPSSLAEATIEHGVVRVEQKEGGRVYAVLRED